MIAKNIKNAVDIQKNGKRVLNVIKNGEIVYYYIPDSYVELEWVQVTDTITIPINNKSLIDYDITIIHDGTDVTTNNVFLKVEGNVRYLFSYGNSTTSGLTVNTIPYIAGKLFTASTTPIRIAVKFTSTTSSLYKNNSLVKTISYANNLDPNNSITIYSRYHDNGSPYKIVNFNIKESSSQTILHNFIPCRRLGDAICGMYDTINQKFYPSETQVQFKGGPIKLIDKEYLNLRTDHSKNFVYEKNTSLSRSKKSFIGDAIYSTQTTPLRHSVRIGDDELEYYHGPRGPYAASQKFERYLFNKVANNQYLQNINPNFNIVKGSSVAANDFETNNQNLYFANKNAIEVVLTGNKKGDSNNISVAKADIQSIIHLPYLSFTRRETTFINLAPIQETADTVYECGFTNNNEYSSALFGYSTSYGGSTYTYCSINSWQLYGAPFTKVTDDYIGDCKLRCSRNSGSFNDKSINYKSENKTNKSFNDFYIGCRDSNGNNKAIIDKYKYLRIERKNSLYRHYLPALMILKDNNYYLGFYETVQQVFYSCDEKTLPAYKGNTLNTDWSNLIDINGNVIDFTKIKLNPKITVTGAKFLSDQSTGIADAHYYRTSGLYIHYKDTDNILDIERGIVGGYLMDNAGVFSPAPFSTPYYTTTITGLGDLTNDVQVYVRIRALTQYPEYDGVRAINAMLKAYGDTYTAPKNHQEQVVHDSSYNSTLKGYINTITGTANDGYVLFKNDDSVAAYETTSDGMVIKHHVFTEAFLKRFTNNTYDGVNPFPYYMEHYFDFKLVHSSGVEYNETITMKYSSTSTNVRTRLLRWENVARVVYSDIPNPSEANPPVANNFLTLYPPVVPDSITTRTLACLTRELYDELYRGTGNTLNIKECLHNSIIRLVDVTISDDLATTTYSNITVVHWKNEYCKWNYGSGDGKSAEMIISANDNTSIYNWDNSVSSDVITNDLLVYKNYDAEEMINEIQFTVSGTTITKLEDVCLHCTPEMFAALVEGQVSRGNSTLNARFIKLKDIQDIRLM